MLNIGGRTARPWKRQKLEVIMSHEEAAAIGRMFREIINHYLSLIKEVQKWQDRARRYRGTTPLDRAVREAVSRLWLMRRPEDVLEQISQFRRSYGGMAQLLAPADQEDQDRASNQAHSPHADPVSMDKAKNGEVKRQCQAVARYTGEQCRRPAMSDSPFCHRHRD